MDTWKNLGEDSLDEMPIGTKARESWGSGYWTKESSGRWKWCHSHCSFPRPGAADEYLLPSNRVEIDELC